MNKFYSLVLLVLSIYSQSHSQQYIVNGSAINYGDGLVRLTSSNATASEAGTAWNNTKHDLNTDFEIEVDMFFGCITDANGGDGITFQFQNSGLDEVGGTGGFLAMSETPSIAIEFDTWQFPGFGDLAEDHITIIKNGNPNNDVQPYLAGPIPVQGNRDLEDCAQFANDYYSVKITWDAVNTTLSVFENESVTASLQYSGDIVNEIFGGESEVFWGFTGSTGNAFNEQWVAPKGSVIPWDCKTNSCCSPFEVNTTGPATLCNGDEITLEVIGNYIQYNWSNGDVTAGTKITSPNTYTVDVLQDQGGVSCPSSDTIVVKPTGPAATIAGDNTICNDGSTAPVTVSITGGAPPYTIEYVRNASENISINGVSTPYVIQAPVGEYKLVSVRDGSGCNGFINGSATISTYPASPIAINDTVCKGEAATLAVIDEGGTYEWYATAVDNTVLNIGVSYPTSTLNEATNFYVQNTIIPDSVTSLVGTGITGAGWDPVPGRLRFTSSISGKLVSVDLRYTGTTTTGKVLVNINDLTDPSLNKNYTFENIVSNGAQYGTFDFNYSLISGHQYDFVFTANTGISPQVMFVSNANLPNTTWPEITFDSYENPSPGVTPWFGTNWIIKYPNEVANCGRTKVTAEIITGAPTTVDFDLNQTEYCPGEALIATIKDTVGGGSSPVFEWYVDGSFVSNNVPFTINSLSNEDKIFVKMVPSIKCNQDATAPEKPILINTNPTLSVTPVLDEEVYCLDDVVATASIENQIGGGGIPTYDWYLNNQLIGSGSSINLFDFNHEDKLFVVMNSSLTCADKVTSNELTLKLKDCECEFFVPNSFSPNGDGINDTWEISGLDCQNSQQLKVFNRWGNLVFESYNYDGRWGGNDLPIGTYFYTIIFNNSEQKETIFTGALTIVR